MLKKYNIVTLGLVGLFALSLIYFTTLLLTPPDETIDQGNPYRFRSSSTPNLLPKVDKEADLYKIDFSTYKKLIQQSIRSSLQPRFQSNNRPFVGGYSLEEVVDFRSPDERLPGRECEQQDGSRLGFLVLHALTDTTYSGKVLSDYLEKTYPCAVFRAPLMPGHGTVPGDSLDPKQVNYQQWIRMVDYSLSQFAGDVDQLFLIGYSTGFTLAVHHLQEKGNRFSTPKGSFIISGVIGMAPALRAKDPEASFLPWFYHLLSWWDPFYYRYPDTNPMKYESFSWNLAHQFYQLTQLLHIERPFPFPLFMLLSSDDQTADPKANYDFYCQAQPATDLFEADNSSGRPLKTMVWYQGWENDLPACEGMIKRSSEFPEYKISNLSHGGVVFPTEEIFYGFGRIHDDCSSYFDIPYQFKECQKDSNTIIYGENNIVKNLALKSNQYFQRVTFNPDFDYAYRRMVEFIDRSR